MPSEEPIYTCGIIMPISYVDDAHDEKHWERVRQIFEAAIERAGLTPKPVWEGGQHDVIQARILQNIFENEVVLCDISTRNANVMLEWGMRLSTKRPTLVVAEKGTPLPFDTSIIHTEFYDPLLEWNSIQATILNIAARLQEIHKAARAGEYRSYLENFKFEQVKPDTVSVSANDVVLEKLEALASQVKLLTDDVTVARRERQARSKIATIDNALSGAFSPDVGPLRSATGKNFEVQNGWLTTANDLAGLQIGRGKDRR